MENLMVDSCVFFGMIEYNNFVQKYGKNNLDRLLNYRSFNLEKTQNEIKNSLGMEFFEKYNHLKFEKQINKYKEYVNNLIGNYENEIKKCNKILNGDIPYNFPESKKIECRNRIIKAQENINSIIPFEQVDEMLNEYRIQRNSLGCGLIYKNALEGNYNLFTNAYSYDEIINHTIPKDNPKWLCFSREEVDSLGNFVRKIYSTSENVLSEVDSLAKDYRTENELPEDTAMSNDINSLGEYGDSKIAAFSNYVGMNLVTNNGKDFIFDKGNNINNRFIRNHLQNVNKTHIGTTDASVYEPFEILEGTALKPQIRSSLKFKVVNFNAPTKTEILNDARLEQLNLCEELGREM